MKKIKNFKITLRQGYILRELKKRGISISEEDLYEKIKAVQDALAPATIYDTFSSSDPAGIINCGASVSVSIYAVTLGKKLDAVPADEVTSIIIGDAMAASVNFVKKLVQIEAEKDRCELLDAVEMPFADVFSNSKLCEAMEFLKIDVSFDGGRISPGYTQFYSIGWLLKKKKR